MKTPFTKKDFTKKGIYLFYGPGASFVARFKHKGPVTMAEFKKELIRNHTVEDYFHALNHDHKAPLVILKEKNPVWYNAAKEVWMAK